MSPRSGRAVSLVVSGSLLMTACQAWRVEERPIQAIVQQNHSPIAVTMNDRRWIVLKDAQLHSDSVVGRRLRGNTKGSGRTALSLSGVRAVETRRFSFIRTIGLGIALAFVPSLYRLAVVEED